MFRQNILDMTGYVPGEQPRQGSKVIKLNTNENPYPCSPKVIEAIGLAAEGNLQKYPDPDATAFRMVAGDLLGVDPSWILCGNGSDEILTILTRSFVGENERLRCPTPSYVYYKALADIQGATCEMVSFEFDWSLGSSFVENSQALKLAFIPNPNSPSGTVLPPSRLEEIANALPCPLVVDEAYGDFAESTSVPLIAKNERIIVTRTLSKSYSLAGLRFGFVVAQPHLIEQFSKVKDSYNCDALSIAGATAALLDQKYLAECTAKIKATRIRLAEQLTDLGFNTAPSEANFVWATRDDRPVRPIHDDLKRNGIFVRYFDYTGWGEGLRVTVGTDEQIDAFLAVLKSIL